MATHLQENSEYNNSNGSCYKQILSVDGVRQSKGQGKANCPSQTSIGKSKLVFESKRDGFEGVDDLGQHQYTYRTERHVGQIDVVHSVITLTTEFGFT